MTTSATSDNAAAFTHGSARYRTTTHGTQVVIPTHCRRDEHLLSPETCRIRETADCLHVTCLACLAGAEADHTWSLTTQGRTAFSAEFDNEPYRSTLRPT